MLSVLLRALFPACQRGDALVIPNLGELSGEQSLRGTPCCQSSLVTLTICAPVPQGRPKEPTQIDLSQAYSTVEKMGRMKLARTDQPEVVQSRLEEVRAAAAHAGLSSAFLVVGEDFGDAVVGDQQSVRRRARCEPSGPPRRAWEAVTSGCVPSSATIRPLPPAFCNSAHRGSGSDRPRRLRQAAKLVPVALTTPRSSCGPISATAAWKV